MSFTDCVESAVRAGTLTRDQAQDLFQRQQDAADRFALDPQHSPESAARLADEMGIERAKQNVRLQKYQASLQAVRNAENINRALSHPNGPTIGLRSLLARDEKGRATWQSIETHETGIKGIAHAFMAEDISNARTRWLGLTRDKKLMQDGVREMFGESSGNPRSQQLAKDWAKVAEMLRLRFNRAGGAIPKREDWGLPQTHDAILVGRVPVGEWVDFVKTRLDLEKMIDIETGAPFTRDSIDVTLQGIYETIRTNGLSDMVPGAQGGKKMANRRQEARFLVFKGADNWLDYQAKFGSPNILATLTGHIDGMARDIALMEKLGPNPSAAFRMLQDVASKIEDRPIRRIRNEAMFNILNGTGDRNKSTMLSDVLGSIRSFEVFSKLGSASLSAISDLGFLSLTTRWSGMRVMRTMSGYLEQIRPGNEADRIFATRLGITALSSAQSYSNVGRFTELDGASTGTLGKITHAGNKMAEFTLRASGLSAMTDAGRRGFAMNMAGEFAENFDRPLSEIEGNFGNTLREHGMTAEEWDLLRQTPTTDHKGARFLTVDQLMDRTDLPTSQLQKLAARYQGIINEEMLHAVPEPDVNVRAFTTGGRPRGSIPGEVLRSVTQFKSFSFAVLSLHLSRMLYARKLRGNMSAAAYAAHGIIATTTLGLLATQLKLISKGQDPRDLDDPKTWAAGFIQGGGAGIYGDFLFSDANRFGSGPITTLAGPTVGTIEDAWRMTWGNAQQLMAGEDPKLAADVVGFGKRYLPGGSLWYTRLLLEREITDQLAMEADPSGTRRRNAAKEKRARDQGSDYWWRPGQRSPDRAPDLGAE